METNLLKCIRDKLCDIEILLRETSDDVELQEICDCVSVSHQFGPVTINVGGTFLSAAGDYVAGADFPIGLQCINSVSFLLASVLDPLDPVNFISIDYGDGTHVIYNQASNSHCYSCDGTYEGYYAITFSEAIYSGGEPYSFGNGFTIEVENGSIVGVSINAMQGIKTYDFCTKKGFARYSRDGSRINIIDAQGDDITASNVGQWAIECSSGALLDPFESSVAECACDFPPPQGNSQSWGGV